MGIEKKALKNPTASLPKRNRRALKIALAIAYKVWQGVRKHGYAPKVSRKLPALVRFYLKRILKENKISNPPSFLPYGHKTNYRKIEIFVNGRYVGTTTWAKSLKQAKEKFCQSEKFVNPKWVTTRYK